MAICSTSQHRRPRGPSCDGRGQGRGERTQQQSAGRLDVGAERQPRLRKASRQASELVRGS